MDLLQFACVLVIDLCALYHRYTDGHWSRPALSCVAFTHVGLLIHVLLETLKQQMSHLPVKAGLELWEYLVGVMKAKSDASSYTLTYGADVDWSKLLGYAYKAPVNHGGKVRDDAA
ncbi:hypothetical protein ASPACDRAFT_1854008 [Aspergillus aculeatus ATCC 16872]|uniref:Uncharacterized protein n=1 Tax=Aspergillus aculeatus (strain ATCC 16872 / CBS 172.66 / WB 5094) TaxID=690307 RepID=A0A1L9X0L5_ASPA1|nr:uncharacterized protein ASPACDRAFT_1854008 [Aspergillus aculeatus ATCC 16872]OJK01991.1 hypothetical protein ASPACDRAFT_1854008 [Aspergillus aculeatus ATCC 16872]